MVFAEKKDEFNIEQQQVIMDQLFIPKFFQLSFDLWIDSNESRNTFKKILHITKGFSHGVCGARWPAIWLKPGDKLNFFHSFECLDSTKRYGHRYSGNERLSAGEWHTISYQQIPIRNSSIAEMIISINGKISHKMTNRIPRRYDNMKAYFGLLPNEEEPELAQSIKGKIKNFKLRMPSMYFSK